MAGASTSVKELMATDHSLVICKSSTANYLWQWRGDWRGSGVTVSQLVSKTLDFTFHDFAATVIRYMKKWVFLVIYGRYLL